MSFPYSIFSVGDQAVALEIDRAVDADLNQRLVLMKRWIEKNSFGGLRDVIIGYRTITITYDVFQTTQSAGQGSASDFVKQKLTLAYQSTNGQGNEKVKPRELNIPVCYHAKFGLDTKTICSRTGISETELVQLHSCKSYKVYLVGFLPGFPYLGFVDPRIEFPRHSSPRANVPTGSVGIAGTQTGIYPFDSPGGWQIIGRTPLKIFNSQNSTPALFEIGDIVTFYPITELEFDHLQNSTR
jgi:inhibitor of KinA